MLRVGIGKFDDVATELTVSGLSGVHALYLGRVGTDFLIGDGRAAVWAGVILESYYSARLFPGFFASFDLQPSPSGLQPGSGAGVDPVFEAACRHWEGHA
jgi:hypothetical protein